MSVETPCIQYRAMKEKGSWKLCKALLGGTPGMQKEGTEFLPQEPEEDDDRYAIRLKRSFLHNAYGDTIDKLVARPFSRPATWDIKNNEDAKAAIKPVMENMDGEGQHHQDFAKEFLTGLIEWGVCHAWADYPEIDEEKRKNQKAKDVDRDELLPTNRVIKAPPMIGWATEERANGTERVIEVRIEETYVEDGDNWEQTAYEQIRVIRADGTWELYRRTTEKAGRKVSEKDFKKVEGSAGSGTQKVNDKDPNKLMIVTAYTKKTGLMTAQPALWELAWTNLELWQSASDQKNILRFDRFGILAFFGFSKDEIKNNVKVAPTQAIATENAEAHAERIETNGKPAENGWKDLMDIMERLEILGMAPMLQRMANVKATGIANNESKSRSQMESWVEATSMAIRQLIQLDLEWMGFTGDKAVPLEDIEYKIHQDFVFGTQASQEIKDVIEARKMGDISHVDFIKEMQRYGRMMDDDATAIAARAQAEQGRGVGMFGEGGGTGSRAAGEPLPSIGEGAETVGAGI